MHHQADARGATGARPTVLVVDDDSEMRAVLQDLLTGEGFAVLGRPDGPGALRALACERPAVIVLDMQMPGGNGLDLLTSIRRQHPSVPVILVTAFGGAETRTRALERGAAAYLDKPFRIAALIENLRAVLERQRAGGRPAIESC